MGWLFGVKRFCLTIPGFEVFCRLITIKHIRVLMYHRFAEDEEKSQRPITRQLFSKQLHYCSMHHEFISAKQHLEYLELGWPGSRPPLVITVDDGYSDFYDVAFPVLKRFSVPATLFVTTGFVLNETWFWWDKIFFILEKLPKEPLSFNFLGKTISGTVESSNGVESIWRQIAPALSEMQNEKKEKLVNEMARLLDVELPTCPPPKYSPVTWEQIKSMQAHGIDIGAHTVNHPILSRVCFDEAKWEIDNSKKCLEKELQVPVSIFCYPQGGKLDFSREHKKMVKESGFVGAYSTFRGSSNANNPFSLPRYGVSNNWTNFRWMLCGAEYLSFRIKHSVLKAMGMRNQ